MARIVEIRPAGPGPFHAPRQPPGHGLKPPNFAIASIATKPVEPCEEGPFRGLEFAPEKEQNKGGSSKKLHAPRPGPETFLNACMVMGHFHAAFPRGFCPGWAGPFRQVFGAAHQAAAKKIQPRRG